MNNGKPYFELLCGFAVHTQNAPSFQDSDPRKECLEQFRQVKNASYRKVTKLISTKTVTLALGTNLGDRAGNLRAAIAALPPAVIVLGKSFVYETLPWGLIDQPNFLNMVILGETQQEPQDLLRNLKELETHLGRVPSIHYGPRKIDIDILFYDNLILDSPELTVPHPLLHERAFVLVPLADLAPEQIHPVLGRTIRQLLAEVETSGVTRYG